MSGNTRAAYERSWKQFLDFCQTHALQHLPVDPSNLALYIAHLHDQNFASNTIRSMISAISFHHKIQGHPDPSKHFLIQKLLQGCSKTTPRAPLRSPITLDLLARLVETVSLIHGESYQKKLFSAMFTVAFFGFLRVGEMVNNKCPAHVLQLDNIVERSTQFFIKFSSFKFSRGRTPQIALKKYSNQSICPVRNLKLYLRVRGSHPGDLFCEADKSPISRSKFYSNLNSCLSAIGSKAKIQGHSFRIGAATWAASVGMSDAQIRRLGRWTSNSFIAYIR